MSVVLQNICKDYLVVAQKVQALKNINLTIAKGSRVAVMGKSGAGKSTLLHVIGTLERPTQGSLCIDDNDVSLASDAAASEFRNTKIGFVFQASNLLPEFTAIENVMMPALIRGWSYRQAKARAAQLLERTSLGHRMHHRPAELSGGEQQRTTIARALIMNPSLILADEPTGNLDKKTGIKVRELLLELCTEFNATMLLVTHDQDLATCFAQKLHMEDGRIIEQNL